MLQKYLINRIEDFFGKKRSYNIFELRIELNACFSMLYSAIDDFYIDSLSFNEIQQMKNLLAEIDVKCQERLHKISTERILKKEFKKILKSVLSEINSNFVKKVLTYIPLAISDLNIVKEMGIGRDEFEIVPNSILEKIVHLAFPKATELFQPTHTVEKHEQYILECKYVLLSEIQESKKSFTFNSFLLLTEAVINEAVEAFDEDYDDYEDEYCEESPYFSIFSSEMDEAYKELFKKQSKDSYSKQEIEEIIFDIINIFVFRLPQLDNKEDFLYCKSQLKLFKNLIFNYLNNYHTPNLSMEDFINLYTDALYDSAEFLLKNRPEQR